MTQMILFDGAYYNPALIWKISRVTNTVTLTIVLASTPAGSAFEEDHVFLDEPAAILELEAFVKKINDIELNDLICCVADGVLSNADLTKGFEKTQGVPVAERRIAISEFILEIAEAIKTQADLP